MNSRQFDDLSFKFLSATILAGVLAAFMAPSAPSATAMLAATPVIASQPVLAALPVTPSPASAPVALATAPDTAAPLASPAAFRHHGHRRGLEKS
jgi:hypothetical protein